MLGERIACGKRGNGINPEKRMINGEMRRTQSRRKREGINTEGKKSTEDTEQNKGSRCLTIGEGGNKLSPCGNSWNDCFKSIF
jgi:hypothetical protein